MRHECRDPPFLPGPHPHHPKPLPYSLRIPTRPTLTSPDPSIGYMHTCTHTSAERARAHAPPARSLPTAHHPPLERPLAYSHRPVCPFARTLSHPPALTDLLTRTRMYARTHAAQPHALALTPSSPPPLIYLAPTQPRQSIHSPQNPHPTPSTTHPPHTHTHLPATQTPNLPTQMPDPPSTRLTPPPLAHTRTRACTHARMRWL